MPKNFSDGGPRRLSDEEIDELRQDMQAASAWMRAELKRRRVQREQPEEQPEVPNFSR